MALHSMAMRHGYDGIGLQNAATGWRSRAFAPVVSQPGQWQFATARRQKKSITTTLAIPLAKNAKICKVVQDSSRKQSMVYSDIQLYSAQCCNWFCFMSMDWVLAKDLAVKRLLSSETIAFTFTGLAACGTAYSSNLDISWRLKQIETNLKIEMHTQSHSQTCTIWRLVMSKLTKKVLVCTSNAEALRSGSTFTCPQSWTVNLNCAISCYFQGDVWTFTKSCT